MSFHNLLHFIIFGANLQYLKQIISKSFQNIFDILLKQLIFADYMKTTFVKHIFIYLSVIYFLLGGVGYNIVNYCCQTCANEGIEEIATSSCFNIHHHFKSTNIHQNQKDPSFCDLFQSFDNCQFLRINTDIPSIQAIHQLHVEQICSVCLFNYYCMFSDERFKTSDEKKNPPPDNLFTKSGRSILTFHAVLLI